MLDYYFENDNGLFNFICGIIFNNVQANQTLDFTIRFPFAPKQINDQVELDKVNQFTWKTSLNFPLFQKPGPRAKTVPTGGPPGYFQNGFLFIQHFISRAYAIFQNENVSTKFYDKLNLTIQRFPYPPYNDDKFLFSLQFIFPIIMMISFIYPCVNLTKNIVLEKELRLKEIMKIMGLKDWMHWSSWFIDSFIWNIITIIIITILFCTKFSHNASIITHSDPILIFLFFLLHSIATISFCFLLSSFFTNVSQFGLVLILVLIFFYLIVFFPNI